MKMMNTSDKDTDKDPSSKVNGRSTRLQSPQHTTHSPRNTAHRPRRHRAHSTPQQIAHGTHHTASTPQPRDDYARSTYPTLPNRKCTRRSTLFTRDSDTTHDTT